MIRLYEEYLLEVKMFKKWISLDYNFHNENYISIAVLAISAILIKIFNITEILENSIFENMQLVALFIAFILCFFAKKHKNLFYFIALILFLMFARELNYGRAIFCQMPDNPHEFYKWSHYKYGYLAHIIVGIYIAISILFGLIKKIWIDVIEIFKKIKFPFWTFFGCLICTIAQIIGEEKHNTCIEETGELILYCLIICFIIIYLKKINNDN